MVGPFDDLAGKMPNKPSETLIDRYSFTGDILSYRDVQSSMALSAIIGLPRRCLFKLGSVMLFT